MHHTVTNFVMSQLAQPAEYPYLIMLILWLPLGWLCLAPVLFQSPLIATPPPGPDDSQD